ncbi:MAG TPA: fibronectin type III domain-containing protein [Pyrinomonadaceae bacterium]|nr:fibronectin type III domain-containing protein [Pyrinomonadaceae bacterium]
MAAKVSLSFGRMPDTELDNFAQGVTDAMTGNAAFPTPPVTLVNLQAAKDDFTAKLAAAQIGGVADTAAKNNSRQILIGMLRDVANYVQIKCNNDPATLLSSGFQMQSTNRAQIELSQPTGLAVTNGSTGQLIARVDPVKNANMYEGRIKLIDGDWLPSVFTGDSQHIIFNGLTRGKDYTAQVRALGGSTGQSDWSDPSTHMAM